MQITDDDVVEQRESFDLILEGPPDLDSSVVITQGVAVVYILDDDGTFTHYTKLDHERVCYTYATQCL